MYSVTRPQWPGVNFTSTQNNTISSALFFASSKKYFLSVPRVTQIAREEYSRSFPTIDGAHWHAQSISLHWPRPPTGDRQSAKGKDRRNMIKFESWIDEQCPLVSIQRLAVSILTYVEQRRAVGHSWRSLLYFNEWMYTARHNLAASQPGGRNDHHSSTRSDNETSSPQSAVCYLSADANFVYCGLYHRISALESTSAWSTHLVCIALVRTKDKNFSRRLEQCWTLFQVSNDINHWALSNAWKHFAQENSCCTHEERIKEATIIWALTFVWTSTFRRILCKLKRHNATPKPRFVWRPKAPLFVHRAHCHGNPELSGKNAAPVRHLQVHHGQISILSKKHSKVAELVETQFVFQWLLYQDTTTAGQAWKRQLLGVTPDVWRHVWERKFSAPTEKVQDAQVHAAGDAGAAADRHPVPAVSSRRTRGAHGTQAFLRRLGAGVSTGAGQGAPAANGGWVRRTVSLPTPSCVQATFHHRQHHRAGLLQSYGRAAGHARAAARPHAERAAASLRQSVRTSSVGLLPDVASGPADNPQHHQLPLTVALHVQLQSGQLGTEQKSLSPPSRHAVAPPSAPRRWGAHGRTGHARAHQARLADAVAALAVCVVCVAHVRRRQHGVQRARLPALERRSRRVVRPAAQLNQRAAVLHPIQLLRSASSAVQLSRCCIR